MNVEVSYNPNFSHSHKRSSLQIYTLLSLLMASKKAGFLIKYYLG